MLNIRERVLEEIDQQIMVEEYDEVVDYALSGIRLDKYPHIIEGEYVQGTDMYAGNYCVVEGRDKGVIVTVETGYADANGDVMHNTLYDGEKAGIRSFDTILKKINSGEWLRINDTESFLTVSTEEDDEVDKQEIVMEHVRKLSDITDAEKKMIEDEWFPNFIVGKFVALRFEDSKVMLDYTVGGGPYSMSVGDSPRHLLMLHDMGFNLIGFVPSVRLENDEQVSQ